MDRFLPPRVLDADRRHRGRLLVAASFGFFFITLFFGLRMALVESYPAANVLIMFAGCGLALSNLILFRWIGSPEIPGALLCLEALAIQAFQAYHDLGLDDPVLLWTLVIPWLAAFLVGPTYGFVFAGLIAGVTGGLYLLERGGYVFQTVTGPDEYLLIYFLCASTLAFFLGFLGWFYEGQTLKNLREAHIDLRASNRRTEQVLDTITDGFFSLDPTGRFTDLNAQAEFFLKENKSDLLGRDAREYFSGNVGDDIRDTLRAAAHERLPKTFDAFFPPLNRWFQLHVYPFDEGLSVYFGDITDRKDYERGLIEAKEEAEQLAQVKSTLLANMSHEIRTPLTSIIGFSSIMAQEATGDHQEFAQLIEQNGQRLMATLNSVLDLAQLERGAVPNTIKPIDVAAEIDQIAHLLQPIAEEAGLYLRVECDAEDTSAALDKNLLNRVLNNLISNAIKFTNEGGVVVRVGADAEEVWADVTDTGVGISPAFIPHLFEEFSQESKGMARSFEGSGLGLAISRRLVETMGGVIEVESEQDVGSTFTVRLPRNVPQDEEDGEDA